MVKDCVFKVTLSGIGGVGIGSITSLPHEYAPIRKRENNVITNSL
jgi:hypothetical protein